MYEPLTNREQEVLSLIAQGLSNREIAQRLTVSLGTVKTHSHNIYSKLGVDNRTQALLKAEELDLLSGSNAASPAGDGSAASLRSRATLPAQLTPFIGRETELEQVSAMLADERLRLITLLGAGGMGKTRLAIEAARKAAPAFEDGVFFVSLARISDASGLASAIIEDMRLRIQTGEKPEQQLLSFLRQKKLLLILDNFEHILESVPLLAELLRAAPAIKILVTSRERLNMSAEVVFVLGGLGYDANGDNPDSLRQDAVQLLLQRARHVNPAFELQHEDWVHVRRICELTAGMPLALILAAGWLDMLTLEEIASELDHNIDILVNQLTDLPARQRSMRAVITSSWNRLTKAEQNTFAHLSVFRGGFSREAAYDVAGASLQDLRTLVNRSLITASDGRYHIHDLLRQFAETELAKDPDEQHHVHDLHCTYYADFLRARIGFNNWQYSTVDEIRTEWGNIRAAWTWAVEHFKLDAIEQSVQTLASFWHSQGRYLEGIESFEHAVARLRLSEGTNQRDLLMAMMSTDVGWYYIRLGRLDESERYFEQAYSTFETLGFPELTTTDPLVGLALIASIKGDYDEATQIAEKALRQNEAYHHILNQTYALYVLTGIKLAQGHYEQARDLGLRAVATAEQAQDRWVQAYCLIELGNVARAMGEDETAAQHYQASYAIRQDFGDPEGMAIALHHLGQLALRREDFAEAKGLYQESQQLYQEIYDRGGMATALHGLAQVALGSGDYPLCRDYLYDALHTASEIEYMPLLFAILLTVAELKLKFDLDESCFTLLEHIQRHPASSEETKEHARLLLAQHEAGRHASVGDPHAERRSLDDLAAVVAAAKNDLSRFTLTD